jgi:hypothetical protein
MTITVGRALAVLAAFAVVVGIVIFSWERASGGGEDQVFHSEAAAICRVGLAGIKSSPDFQTAIARSREMRFKLSALTPTPEQHAVFERWLTDLEATEGAALRGDRSAVQQIDLLAQEDARQLGLAQSCITTPN